MGAVSLLELRQAPPARCSQCTGSCGRAMPLELLLPGLRQQPKDPRAGQMVRLDKHHSCAGDGPHGQLGWLQLLFGRRKSSLISPDAHFQVPVMKDNCACSSL